MKAKLEIDMPKTCLDCQIARYNSSGILQCQVKDENGVMLLYRAYTTKRRNDCPLKPMHGCAEAEKTIDRKCKGYQRGELDDEPAEKCKECQDFELYEEDAP